MKDKKFILSLNDWLSRISIVFLVLWIALLISWTVERHNLLVNYSDLIINSNNTGAEEQALIDAATMSNLIFDLYSAFIAFIVLWIFLWFEMIGISSFIKFVLHFKFENKDTDDEDKTEINELKTAIFVSSLILGIYTFAPSNKLIKLLKMHNK